MHVSKNKREKLWRNVWKATSWCGKRDSYCKDHYGKIKEQHDMVLRDQFFELACGDIRVKYIEYQKDLLRQFKERREYVEGELNRISNRIRKIEGKHLLSFFSSLTYCRVSQPSIPHLVR